ncbi:MAG: hypothetical protein CFE35_00510 [Novosphingobium sp. PASSN1]|nr:MAG: hypothetical protein CFE35_00510 [Novosphingobium sp. PASSN1]
MILSLVQRANGLPACVSCAMVSHGAKVKGAEAICVTRAKVQMQSGHAQGALIAFGIELVIAFGP